MKGKDENQEREKCWIRFNAIYKYLNCRRQACFRHVAHEFGQAFVD